MANTNLSNSLISILEESLTLGLDDNTIETSNNYNNQTQIQKEKSASSLLLESKRNQIKEFETLNFIPLSNSPFLSPFESQIASSEITNNSKLESLMNNKSSSQTNQHISKAKRKKMEKGEQYKDKSNEKFVSKSNRKSRMDKLHRIY